MNPLRLLREGLSDADGTIRAAMVLHRAYPFIMLLDAEGDTVFRAPPDGDSGRGGLDWKGVFGV